MKNCVKSANKYNFLLCAIVSATLLVSPALASSLPPELGDWRLSSEHVTELASSENLGKWTSASYVRASPMAAIEVQLTEGTGPGALFVPEGMISSDDGPIGFSSMYETLTIAGRRAVLEQNSITGQALAVNLEACTVTFETRGISREELLAFAESMAETLQNSK